MKLGFVAVIHTFTIDILINDSMGGYSRDVTIKSILEEEKHCIVGKVIDIGIIVKIRGVSDGILNNVSDVGNIGFDNEELGKFSAGDNLLPASVFIFFKKLRGFMKMGKLFFEAFFPNLFYSQILFVTVAGVIEIALVIFVHKHHFKPGCIRVNKAFVERNMLFFY